MWLGFDFTLQNIFRNIQYEKSFEQKFITQLQENGNNF